MEALPALGLNPLPMDGAFYAYCDIGRFSNDSMAFAKKALHEAGLAITLASISTGRRGTASSACPMPAARRISSRPLAG